MANTITISRPAYEQLLIKITKLEKAILTLVNKIDNEPSYGSDQWWDWSIKKGKEAIKKGEYVTIKSDEDFEKLFKTL